MSKARVVIISPPFYSQLGPLLTLAGEFAAAGHEAAVACAAAFAAEIQARGFAFIELRVSRNANTGIASRTVQPAEEKRRLEAFLAATRRGGVETLLLQSAHRRRDMFADPAGLLVRLREIAAEHKPDLWIVDQLSYGVTLALYLLEQRFITFCPGHPSSIPEPDQLFGVPPQWPSAVQPEAGALARLRRRAARVERRFTGRMNTLRRRSAPQRPEVASAFRLCSSEAVLYNYPPFPGPRGGRFTDDRAVYMGWCFTRQTLKAPWHARMRSWAGCRPKILIAFGTFLAARSDVIRRCVEALRSAYPGSLIVVSGGAEADRLRDLAAENVCIEPFIPQPALLPAMDLIIHHGGCNSFTEALYYAVPMIVMPFSSDQFAIAADAEQLGLGGVLNPNDFTAREIADMAAAGLEKENPALRSWQLHLRERGPAWAVRQLMPAGEGV
jgi:MGT family glycosyltransferase